MLAEFIGVMMFLLAIVGSKNNFALAITLGLMVWITASISGGHLNPAVSLYFFSRKEMSAVDFVGYLVAQLLGSLAGVAMAAFFKAGDVAGFTTRAMTFTPALFVSEVVATAGLVWLIATLIQNKQATLIPFGVMLWVLAASLFTPTGAQANPAVTLGLMFNGNQSVSGGALLILAEIVGLMVAVILGMLLTSATAKKKAAAKK